MGSTPLSRGLSRSIASIAPSTRLPISGRLAESRSRVQRASGGTQNTFSENESEMYLRKMRPSTTCLYSAASMLPRKVSAAAQRVASNPNGAEPLDPLALAFDDRFGIARIVAASEAPSGSLWDDVLLLASVLQPVI